MTWFSFQFGFNPCGWSGRVKVHHTLQEMYGCRPGARPVSHSVGMISSQFAYDGREYITLNRPALRTAADTAAQMTKSKWETAGEAEATQELPGGPMRGVAAQIP